MLLYWAEHISHLSIWHWNIFGQICVLINFKSILIAESYKSSEVDKKWRRICYIFSFLTDSTYTFRQSFALFGCIFLSENYVCTKPLTSSFKGKALNMRSTKFWRLSASPGNHWNNHTNLETLHVSSWTLF